MAEGWAKTKTISSKQNLKKAVHTMKSVNTKEIRMALTPCRTNLLQCFIQSSARP